ncbi:MAG: nicotinate-nucleotide adenylyltransferase [Anaerolineales bacterium]
MPRLGIFGGTFDPPHIGHLILAAEAQYQLRLDGVLWVLTAVPPHKRGQEITPLEKRLAMLQAAIADEAHFTLSRVDIDRPPPHYAVDTVRLLRRAYPEAALIYLMGGDSLRDLPAWHTPQDFVAACDSLGVVRRPGETVSLAGVERVLPGSARKIQFVDAPLLEIASRDIRARISAGRPARYFLPPAVWALIKHWGLYAAQGS